MITARSRFGIALMTLALGVVATASGLARSNDSFVWIGGLLCGFGIGLLVVEVILSTWGDDNEAE